MVGDMPTSSFTTSQAARLLGISAERVRQLADNQQLACTRTELGRLFDVEELERFARERLAAHSPSRAGGQR